MTGQLTLRLLGEATIEQQGQSITTLPSRTAEALLFYLVCHERALARESLAEMFWEERQPQQASANLRSILSALRQVFGNHLLVTRTTVGFNHESDYGLDAAAFLHQITPLAINQPLSPAELDPLRQALTLYRGEFLAGFHLREGRVFEEWVLLQRERYQRLAHIGLSRLVTYCLKNGLYAEGVTWGEKLLALDPYDEQAWRQLMWLWVRNGQRHTALQRYETGRELLQAELGIEPAPATRNAYERIRALIIPPPNHLPLDQTPFVGRTEELTQLAHHLTDPTCRLLTVTGAGGIGKTRLAIAAAQHHFQHYPGHFLHGLFFVSLVGIQQTEFLVTAIATVLDIPLQGLIAPEQQVINYLKEREMLLILDNVEQLLGEASTLIPFLDQILHQAPQVKLLLTSREPLNLHQEYLFALTGLPCPPDEAIDVVAAATYSAVQLFWQNARRVNRHFAPSAEESRAINQICALLEGTPLALELAAAAVRHTTCTTIWQTIQHNLSALESGWHNLPSRHRSLRASYDYSWQLLNPAEQTVLMRLAVFPGGFMAEAAEQVAAAFPALLTTLLDKSLIRQSDGLRYTMHPLIHQFVAARLAEEANIQHQTATQHSRYYMQLLGQQISRLRAATQDQALALIGQEIENIRQAWRHAVQELDLAALAEGYLALYRFYDTRGWFAEGKTIFQLAVTALETHWGPLETMPDAAALLTARLIGRLGWFVYQTGHLTEAPTYAQQSAAAFQRLNSVPDLAQAYHDQAIYARRLGDYQQAKTWFETSLYYRRQVGDEWETARTLSTMANTLRLLGEYAAAQELLQESITLQQSQGDAVTLANSLNNLGEVARALGNYAEARHYYEENLRLRRQVGDNLGLGTGLNNLSSVAHAQGDYAGAKQYAQESLHVLRETGGDRHKSYPLSVLGRVARDEGHYVQALTYFREALRLAWGTGYIPKSLDVLFETATVFLAQGERLEAIELLTLIAHHEKINAETRAAADEFLAEAVAGLKSEVVAEAQARGRELTLTAIVTRLLQTLPQKTPN